MPIATTRRRSRSLGAALAAIAAFASACAPVAAAPLVEEAFLLGDQFQPASNTFDLAAAGDFNFRLSDLRFPQPLGTATALLTRGTSPVSRLTSFGTIPVALQGGRHKVLVAATPANVGGFGAFGVSLQPVAGGSNVLDFSDQARATQPAVASLQSTLQASFAVTVPGTYRLAVADLGFPGPLQRLDVLVATPGGAVVATLGQAVPSAEVSLPAGNYDLLAFAEATPVAAAGAYSVTVSGAGTQPYSEAHGVGALSPARSVTLGAGDTHTMQVIDYGVPAPLAGVQVLVTRGDTVLARTAGTGSTTFTAAAGGASLFVLQSPGAGFNRGASGIVVASGTTRVFEHVEVTSPAPTSGEPVLVVEPIDLPASGTYRIGLADFEFPAMAAAAAMHVIQGGSELARLTAPGSIDAVAAAGRMFLLVDAAPGTLTRSSLLGTNVLQSPAGATVAESTLALGILLQTRFVDIPTSGSYDLALSDLAFPTALGDLALAVTRGGQRVASIYGSGSVRFNATAGRYALNLLARPTDTRGFGAYSLLLDATPPPPVITFSANPTRIRQGETTQLTWSASGATTCVASDGWSGSRATAGTATSAVLNAGTRFTLTCSGPGGSATSSVDVEVRPVSTSGGGGAAGAGLALLLATLALSGRRRRCAR